MMASLIPTKSVPEKPDKALSAEVVVKPAAGNGVSVEEP